jgi:zinc transport system ATP-binding protein
LGKLKGGTTILIVTHDMDFVSALTDRALCMGDAEGEAHRYGIVQHRTEATHILHGDSIAADSCFEEDAPPKAGGEQP